MVEFNIGTEWAEENYSQRKVDWGPLGEIVYRRTYSRDGEEWWQTVLRVVNGCYTWQKRHCIENGRPWNGGKAMHSAKEMYALIFDFKFLPPGRGLFTMGVPGLLEKAGAAANNCGFTSTKNPAEAFCWAMDHLMLGVGVGFDTLGQGVKIYKPGTSSIIASRGCVVDDSREGWVEALRTLLNSYFGAPTGCPPVPVFDYSKVRPKGSPVGFGGNASGPEPLKEMLESVQAVLEKCAIYGGRLLSTDIVDIMNLIGRCIVSGNIRRSAEIAFGFPDDKLFQEMKNKEKYPDENASHRWAANHSIMCEQGQDYAAILDNTSGVDELGIMWLDNARRYSRMGGEADNADMGVMGANPCAEQSLEDKELCCLVELFPSRHESYYELLKTLKYAYLYAKTVTTIPVHDTTTNAIIKRNRRIGCSMTGIQQALVKHGTALYDWCDDGYAYLKALDAHYSEWFGIPRSIKLTSVKPSGSVSKLPGVTSGIHFPPAEHYFQRIRFASDSEYVEPYRAAGYECEDLSPGEPNTTAIKFPVSVAHFSRSEDDVSPWEQAIHAVKMQRHWADNQVSITVKFDKEKRDELEHICRMVEGDLKAISFFPRSNTHGFHAPPWEPATKEEVDEYRRQLSPVMLESHHEKDELYCSNDSCEIPQEG